MNEFVKLDLDQYETLAKDLDLLQMNENEGRGVGCVKTIISCLQKGDVEEARAVCFNEGDKLEGYDKIKILLISSLFNNEKHPWS